MYAFDREWRSLRRGAFRKFARFSFLFCAQFQLTRLFGGGNMQIQVQVLQIEDAQDSDALAGSHRQRGRQQMPAQEAAQFQPDAALPPTNVSSEAGLFV